MAHEFRAESFRAKQERRGGKASLVETCKAGTACSCTLCCPDGGQLPLCRQAYLADRRPLDKSSNRSGVDMTSRGSHRHGGCRRGSDGAPAPRETC